MNPNKSIGSEFKTFKSDRAITLRQSFTTSATTIFSMTSRNNLEMSSTRSTKKCIQMHGGVQLIPNLDLEPNLTFKLICPSFWSNAEIILKTNLLN